MSRQTRRALLRGTAVTAIAGLAGCSATGSTGSTETVANTDTGSSESTATERPTESTATAEPTTTVSSKPVTPAMHAASETTGFGVDLAGVPVVGDADATLDLYYWSDYQCPFCQKFEHRTLPKLVRTHVSEGRLRIPLLQFPNIGKNSTTLSVMSRCVWRQTRENTEAFWNWHTTMFEEQGFPNGDWSKRSNLLELTRGVEGVDADAVDACMEENRDAIVSKVEAERKRGQNAGLDGTPSFVVYDPEADRSADLQGAQPYSRFDSTVRSLLE